jgi:hypothetical protein
VLLALLGTVTGFAPMLATNPRMGLAAHVGGIMNALLLLALGAVWSAFTLPAGRQRLASRLLVAGAYANWAITLLASITGAREFAPLAGEGYGATALVENATLWLISLAALCTLSGLGLVVSGLGRRT